MIDMARLQEQYESELKGQIQKTLGLGNVMQVPRITKITLDTPENRGMINKVSYLLSVEEV